MEYVIVMDSCGEKTEKMRQDPHIISAPLTIQLDKYSFTDDDSFDQADFLKKIAASPDCPKSACPSPDCFMAAFEKGEKRAYAVTLSAELSGSFNSAMLAKDMFLENHPNNQAHVFNSRSASVGETLVTAKIQECEEAGMSFEEVVDTVEAYIDEQNTYFVLENLETLRKNGRLSNIKAILASALRIKPVMGATAEGTIIQLDQARGINKALLKMADYAAQNAEEPENKILAVAHCNCPERGRMVLDALKERLPVKDSFFLDTGGISTMYANDGGIIVVI